MRKSTIPCAREKNNVKNQMRSCCSAVCQHHGHGGERSISLNLLRSVGSRAIYTMLNTILCARSNLLCVMTSPFVIVSTQTGQKLTQVVVRSAGHIVPYDQPRAALDMITRFIIGKSFQKDRKKENAGLLFASWGSTSMGARLQCT